MQSKYAHPSPINHRRDLLFQDGKYTRKTRRFAEDMLFGSNQNQVTTTASTPLKMDG